MMYVQCKLVKERKYTVSFIPEKFAVIGKTVGLKTDGVWEEGWTVTKLGGKEDESAVVEMRDRYKHHRKGTDI